MKENGPLGEKELVDRAIDWLREALPSSWSVSRSNRAYARANLPEPQTLGDSAIDLVAKNSSTVTLLVEAKRSFSPRDVERTFTPQLWRLQTMTYPVPILVVSEWLSPRTRELLRDQGINYLDLTGNAFVSLDNPALVYIRSTGASRGPKQATRGQVRLRGAKAARIVRLLIDVQPPYGVREIADASGVVVSWVSRLLESLDREALIERSARGKVVSVDIPRLLHRWAEVYDVFSTNETNTFLAPQGAGKTLERMKDEASVGRLAVTGSFAAIRLAPVAAPALLVAYSDDVDRIGHELDLLPADEGSNVALLRPYDRVVWDRSRVDDGVRYVAPSQIAIDSLTGNGRMPAEGEALIDWMMENESQWRLPSLESVSATAEP